MRLPAKRPSTKRFDPADLPPAPDFAWEQVYWAQGIELVAGLDEAGRGALAGPVSAAAVIFPPDPDLQEELQGLDDSKKLSPAARRAWAQRIKEMALAWGVGMATNQEIDALGIAPATRLAMVRALQALTAVPAHLLIDYLALPELALDQDSLVKGDARCLSIAAASVLAKTARDNLMETFELVYPGYSFAQHKGYGTSAHRRALQRLGLSPIHRRSFRWRGVETDLE
jgi:ribonuclease HII